MTDFREPPLSYYNLEISMFTDKLKPFYLTGEKPLFKIRVHNLGTQEKNGKIELIWKLNDVNNERVIGIDISPGEKKEYELPREWCFVGGTARYYLREMGEPSSNHVKETEEKLREINKIYPLCSYYIRDKEIYEHENAEHEKRLKFDQDMNRYTRNLYLYTIAIFIFTVLNMWKQLYEIGRWLIISALDLVFR